MKKISFLSMILTSVLFLSCDQHKEKYINPSGSTANVNWSSIIPSSTGGRTNTISSGNCVTTYKRNITISLWDSGQIDGDIISFYVNGVKKVSYLTLDGPSNKYTFTVTLDYNGYNYLALYAHNEGSVSPNTAAVSVDGQDVIMSSDLYTNGTLDVVVDNGSGVSCF